MRRRKAVATNHEENSGPTLHSHRADEVGGRGQNPKIFSRCSWSSCPSDVYFWTLGYEGKRILSPTTLKTQRKPQSWELMTHPSSHTGGPELTGVYREAGPEATVQIPKNTPHLNPADRGK